MKKIFYLSILWALPIVVQAQSLSVDKNAVVHSQLRVATTNEADASDPTKALINIQYMDGLGRSLQTIGYKQSPMQKDMVSGAVTYDKYGRVNQSVLTAPASSGTGIYQANPVGLAQSFYGGDTYAFGQTTAYDQSPLNRAREQYGAGQAWRTAEKNSKTYQESAGSEVRLYQLDGSHNLIKNGTFAANSLFKTRVIDEQGHTSISYHDLQGRLIQKQTQDGTAEWITTYYIYDGSSRVKAIIQPEGYQLNQSINYNSAAWDQWIFFYGYNSRSQVIEKKVPGAGAEYFVYDRWDRLVWSQTALQRELGRWTFQKYDVYNRLIMSGEKAESRTREQLQTEVNNWTGDRFESRVSGGDIYYSYSNSYPQVSNAAEIRQVYYYSFYDHWRPGDMLFDGANAYHAQHASGVGFATGGRSRNSENGNWLVYVNYYDNKQRLIQTYHQNLYGHVERTDFKYNFAGEAIEIRYLLRDANNAATIQLERFDYDYAGRKTAYKLGMNAVGETVCVYEYDEIGRMKTKKFYPDQTFSVGGALDYINRPPSPNANIDDIARKAIFLHAGTVIDAATINKYSATINPNASQGTTIQGLQTMNYTYHIRGGLRGINLDGAGNPTPNASQGDLFSYKLDYETSGFYNGNIGKQTWQNVANNSPVGVRSYTYNYDEVSRLKSATYAGINGENFSLSALSYDKNGNILNLQRYGKIGGSASSPTFGLIDNLGYTYNGNRLQSVSDGVSGDHEVDLVPRGSGNYSYYSDGSLKSDNNKEITQIIYDSYLKLPKEIQLTNNRWVKMYYDGSGKLLKRLLSTQEYWEYSNRITFKNGIIYQLAQQEGRLTYDNSVWKPEFYYADHLGNTRVSFGVDGTNLVVKDITDFDPWGLELKGTGVTDPIKPNRYKFLNREKISDFGLGVYSLGARTFDPVLGRFWSVDPLVEEGQYSFTPYHYSFNNPIRFSDPDGLMGSEDPPSRLDKLFSWAKNLFSDDSRTQSEAIQEGVNHIPGMQALNMVNKMARREEISVSERISGNLDYASIAIGVAAAELGGSKGNSNSSDVVEPTQNATPEVVSTTIETKVQITIPYKRPPGSVTSAQRASVQNKPCVDCGNTASTMVADHKYPLVKEYYETGKIDIKKMKDVNSVQPQCPTCSAKQGAEMTKYSRKQKKANGLE